ncbi:hypothetical protein FRC12_019129 [Ceratobasidium sp. 428]|nr:hypothetical protein FRC12_019129 [Ceratobasidium sp. 428]
MALLQFTLILEPVYRALTCLESLDCTLADVFAYWTALLAAVDCHLSSPECTLLPGVISRFRTIINTRYLEALVKAPTANVYLTAFCLHPDFRNLGVFRCMNPMSSKVYIRILAPNPISPAPHIPNSVYMRILQCRSQILRHSLKAAESDPTHPLHGYDAQDAKSEYEEELPTYYVKTMTEQIKVMQWYSMVEGRTKAKPRTPTRFRDLPDASKLLLQQQEAEASEGASNDDSADWFEGEPSQPDPELCAEYSVQELTGQLSALQIINLESPHLSDMLSTLTIAASSSEHDERKEGRSLAKGKEKEQIHTADEVSWD